MEPISQVLYGLFRGTPRHSEWVVACLEGAWPALVGDRIATVCRPSFFEGGRLRIEVTDAAWAAPLREMSAELLTRIRKGTADEVREISFVSI